MGTRATAIRGTRVRLAAGTLAVLIAGVVIANLLWPSPAPPGPGQSRLPPDTSPFPVFRIAPLLHAVTIDPEANLSTHLLWASLQGLVNRVQVELYLDVGGAENASATLADWKERYGISYDSISAQAALDLYARRANGTIVYDPSKPESINIGTMLASQRGALLVGPDLAGWIGAAYGLPSLFEYAASDWKALDPIGAYDRAHRELYPASNPNLLAILSPDRWAIRDYLLATGTFVFYLRQGVLASPSELAATTRILRAAPRGIPILGWLETTTLTEENAFVQLASREGKSVVGVQAVPNLSVMTALGRDLPHGQFPPPTAGPVENKTYVVLAIPDGDNLDFLAGRMRELWSESVDGTPIRGSVPIAWSINPLLVDLAPPLLDAYYHSATRMDRLIAAPSGAGYLYPDYTGPGDLTAFVTSTGRYLQSAGLDVVWLLNAFPATEIPYSEASLTAYVDGLRPRGIVLDYADQPRSRDAWMQIGNGAVAPVIRSTHFWTTADNVLGKVGAVAATWDRGPHFLWLTVYSFRFGLRDALDLVRAMDARLPGGVEVVPVETFFSFLRYEFVRLGTEKVRAMETDPLALLGFRDGLERARRHLSQADQYAGEGDMDRAAAAAFLGLEEVRGIRAAESLLVSVLVLLAAGALAVQANRTRPPAPRTAGTVRLEPLVLLVAAIALFLLALREAVDQNFWTYPTILIGVVVAGLHRPLGRWLDRAWGERAPAIAALLDLIFVSLAIRTSAAFPLAAIGTLLVLDAYLVRRPVTGAEILVGLAFGVALGFVGGFDLITLTVLALLLVAPAVRLRAESPSEGSRPRGRGVLPGLLLTLPLTALAVAFSYSLAARLDVQGDSLVPLAAGLVVVPPAIAILLGRMVRLRTSRTGILSGLVSATAFGTAVFAVTGTVPTTVVLLGLFTSLSFAALVGSPPGVTDASRPLEVALRLLPLLLLFLRMPPIVLSLTIVRLPEPIEYFLYAPTAMIAATSLALFLGILLGGKVPNLIEKHYSRDRDGGP
jgi:putative glycoside hydrolase with GxGYxYP motif/GxGYxY motif-containing protein